MTAQRPSHEREQDHGGATPARRALPSSRDGRLPAPGRLGSSDPAGLLGLQRLAGNAAVGQAVQRERTADDGAADTAVQRSVHKDTPAPSTPPSSAHSLTAVNVLTGT
ncbi:hypothetical protein OH805_03205 [Streptomyces sp. NBC_00879]|uniref:hypothetical protein n=1 Tax=Streptomyces sp. NBC_00879 TaxID=2975855 RepID=UPI00386E9EBE|nr:hypothetical protein OH805_03205 [Streptomyces sp. NBC_00879]